MPTIVVRSLDQGQEDGLLAYLEKESLRDYTMVLLGLKTGLRNSELLGLNVGDVLLYHQVLNAIEVRPEIAKNQKPRWIPLIPFVQEKLERFITWKRRRGEGINPADPLFVSLRGKRRLSPRDFQRMMRGATLQVLGRSYSPHALRHTFATRLMRRSDIRTVQEALGHSSLSSTQIYTHPGKEDMREDFLRSFQEGAL